MDLNIQCIGVPRQILLTLLTESIGRVVSSALLIRQFVVKLVLQAWEKELAHLSEVLLNKLA